MKITCSDLTYKDYVKIVVGKFSEVELTKDLDTEIQQKTRDSLITEFQSLIGDDSFNNYEMLKFNLDKYTRRLQTYDILITLVTGFGIEDSKIKEICLSAKFNLTSTDTKDTVLIRLKANYYKAELRLKAIVKELESLQQKARGSKELSEVEMYQLISNISASLMFSISINDNTVVVAGYIKLLNKQKDK